MVALLGVALALPAGTAAAANQTVMLGPGNLFQPETVTINQGETVTWDNAGRGYHNVVFDDRSFEFPSNGASWDPWIVSRRFMTPGTFGYHCHEHVTPDTLQGMRGTVVVLPASTAGTQPGISPTGTTVLDSAAPKLRIAVPRRQWIVMQRAVFASVKVDEEATITVTAVVELPGTQRVLPLKRARTTVHPGEEADVHLRLSGSNLKALRKRLKRKQRLNARITFAAKDLLGNVVSVSRRVRLIH